VRTRRRPLRLYPQHPALALSPLAPPVGRRPPLSVVTHHQSLDHHQGPPMVARILKAVLGSKNDRVLKRMRKTVKQINACEEAIQSLDDAALAGKTAEFRAR